ncbi:MAG: response regulator [Anaerolineae bacterium]|nr:response regulator [Anaerolineae bacterium]
MDESVFRVLLVDDDPDACAIFKLVMDHHQMPLDVLGDAENVIDYLQTHHPDIVVVDIFLPGMDGFQLLNQIRKHTATSGSKFVATTAYYTNDTIQEVLSRGFDGYISKPFDSRNLVPYLQSLVGAGRT